MGREEEGKGGRRERAMNGKGRGEEEGERAGGGMRRESWRKRKTGGEREIDRKGRLERRIWVMKYERERKNWENMVELDRGEMLWVKKN